MSIKLDLSGIDADVRLDGDQAFVFIGDDAFSGAGGEFRLVDGLLEGDIDGNPGGDVFLAFSDHNLSLSASDILL